MGQARDRGSRDDRVAASRQRAEQQRPPHIACNVCKAELPEVLALDVGKLRGIEVAYQAHCKACDQDTWAVRGEPAAVRAFYAVLEQAAGQKLRMGTAMPRGG